MRTTETERQTGANGANTPLSRLLLPGEAKATRHRALALRALACGHGVQWSADITGLPLRLVARVAAQYRIPVARPVPDVPGPSPWEALVLTPGRLRLRYGGSS